MSERSSRSAPYEGWSDSGDRPLVVSACLLGVACNHKGGASESAVVALGRRRRLIPVCPETVGGLPTPRPAAEQGGTAGRTAAGDDVTDAYTGARHTVALARTVGAAGRSSRPARRRAAATRSTTAASPARGYRARA